MTSLAGGFAVGPGILGFVGTAGAAPFIVATALIALAPCRLSFGVAKYLRARARRRSRFLAFSPAFPSLPSPDCCMARSKRRVSALASLCPSHWLSPETGALFVTLFALAMLSFNFRLALPRTRWIEANYYYLLQFLGFAGPSPWPLRGRRIFLSFAACSSFGAASLAVSTPSGSRILARAIAGGLGERQCGLCHALLARHAGAARQSLASAWISFLRMGFSSPSRGCSWSILVSFADAVSTGAFGEKCQLSAPAYRAGAVHSHDARRALWSPATNHLRGPPIRGLRTPSIADMVEETHFGFSRVPLHDKQARVDDVFHKVASRYDLMNDLMSGGLHRIWKDIFTARIRPSRKARFRHLDVAGGTGDIAFRVANAARLDRGRRARHQCRHAGRGTAAGRQAAFRRDARLCRGECRGTALRRE